QIVVGIDVGWAAVIAEGDEAALRDIRRERGEPLADFAAAAAEHHLVHAAHDAQLRTPAVQRLAGMTRAVDLPGKHRVHAAGEEVRDQRPDVAVAVNPPEIHAVRAQLGADALVPRHHDIAEKSDRDEGTALVADVLPAA